MTPNATEKSFQKPWHASAFALTVHLHESGYFTWPEWAENLSNTLKHHGVDRELDGADDYYNAWIETLQDMLERQHITDTNTIDDVKKKWEAAYLTTPHGEAVALHGAGTPLPDDAPSD